MTPAEPITPTTRLADLSGLPKRSRDKLVWLGAETLGELAEGFSYAQLKRTRGIGAKTLEQLSELLSRAGLGWGERRVLGAALQRQLAEHARHQERLRRRVEAWVASRRPECVAPEQRHQPGGYGRYLRAQLDALDHLDADPTLTRELRHLLVRQLNRYERESRWAKTKDALRDGLQARG